MKPYSVLVIDDEKLARESIKSLLTDNGEWTVIGEAINGKEAIRLIDHHKPDLIFLDIDMPVANGLAVLSAIRHKPHIVFTTAYDNFAVNAFENEAVDYLLKPFTDERFRKALQKVKIKMVEQSSRLKVESIVSMLSIEEQVQKPEKTFAIKTNERIIVLEAKDILWLKSAGNYVELHTADRKHLYYKSMQQLESELDHFDFLRIHRSCMVNRKYIKELKKRSHSSYDVVLKNGVSLKLSRSYKNRVQQIFTAARTL